MSDDKSVLGNLPRSRPGTRSDKRPAPAKRATRPAEPRPAKARPPKPAAARPAAPKPDPAAPVASADSLTEAARVAAKAVGTGVKIGTGLAQEVLRRLPRP
jgi:hypothetical protein